VYLVAKQRKIMMMARIIQISTILTISRMIRVDPEKMTRIGTKEAMNTMSKINKILLLPIGNIPNIIRRRLKISMMEEGQGNGVSPNICRQQSPNWSCLASVVKSNRFSVRLFFVWILNESLKSAEKS
jgi:hypothetical protein